MVEPEIGRREQLASTHPEFVRNGSAQRSEETGKAVRFGETHHRHVDAFVAE